MEKACIVFDLKTGTIILGVINLVSYNFSLIIDGTVVTIISRLAVLLVL